jgi:hypothetical protein
LQKADFTTKLYGGEIELYKIFHQVEVWVVFWYNGEEFEVSVWLTNAWENFTCHSATHIVLLIKYSHVTQYVPPKRDSVDGYVLNEAGNRVQEAVIGASVAAVVVAGGDIE